MNDGWVKLIDEERDLGLEILKVVSNIDHMLDHT